MTDQNCSPYVPEEEQITEHRALAASLSDWRAEVDPWAALNQACAGARVEAVRQHEEPSMRLLRDAISARWPDIRAEVIKKLEGLEEMKRRDLTRALREMAAALEQSEGRMMTRAAQIAGLAGNAIGRTHGTYK